MKFSRRGTFHVYIVRCKGGNYYTGYTSDIRRRIQLHNDGKAAKYTKDRRPVKLVWSKEYRYFKRAFKKEIVVKKMTRKQKEELIRIYARAE